MNKTTDNQENFLNNTSDKILAAATDLFAASPFSAVSLKSIAIASGVNSALISYYYGGKKKLYQEVLYQQSEIFLQISNELLKEDLTPTQRLQKYLDELALLQEARPYCLHLIYRELISPQPTFENFVKTRLYSIHTFMTQLIADVLAEKGVKVAIQPTHAAFTLESIIMFYFLMKKYVRELGDFAPGEESSYLAEALNTYLKALTKS